LAERKKALGEELEKKGRSKSLKGAWTLSHKIGRRAMFKEFMTKPQLIAYSCDAASGDLVSSLKELWRTPVEAYRAYRAFNAMILAGDTLLAANPATKQLLAIKTEDGTKLGKYPLPDATVREGLAAVNGRLYVALEDGSVVCLGE
jgi:hypothetical protein